MLIAKYLLYLVLLSFGIFGLSVGAEPDFLCEYVQNNLVNSNAKYPYAVTKCNSSKCASILYLDKNIKPKGINFKYKAKTGMTVNKMVLENPSRPFSEYGSRNKIKGWPNSIAELKDLLERNNIEFAEGDTLNVDSVVLPGETEFHGTSSGKYHNRAPSNTTGNPCGPPQVIEDVTPTERKASESEPDVEMEK